MISQHLMTSISMSMAFSVALHVFVLFGIALVLPDPRSSPSFTRPLQVVLVNSKSKSRPLTADALAQANLDGGGNTAENRQAKSPLPTIRNDKRFTLEKNARSVAHLEQETKRMLTQLKSDHRVMQPEIRKQKNAATNSGDDLVQKALEIARLEAQINKSWDAYQKLPRRKFIGARTQEYRFAQYIEDWRVKVERIGNLNYPEQARRQKIYGKLQLSVSIRKDGSVETIEVSKSSGQRILDAAAVRIVKMAAPYAKFPEDIRKDTDVIGITRTWTFTHADQLATGQ